MASSLLFRIQSIFDNTGFREAGASFASTLGWIGKLSAGMAGWALQAKNVGAIFAVLAAVDLAKMGFNLVGFLLKAAPAAQQAETTFVRLKGQLDLIGKGSQENLKMVTRFAEETSRRTKFSSDEIQQAITAAARRTGDLGTAIKETNVAIGMAYTLNMDLISATNAINHAQAGYTRGLTQVTDLRKADIDQAVRQGTLLDLLAKKFGSAAKNEASTYAVKLAIIHNLQLQLAQDTGKLVEWIPKLTANLKILALSGLLDTERNVGKLSAGFMGLVPAIMQARKEADKFNKMLGAGREFAFNFDKELELENARLGKTVDERRQITREWARIEDILAMTDKNNVDALTGEQVALIQKYQWSTKELDSLQRARVEGTKKNQKELFDAQQQRETAYDERKNNPTFLAKNFNDLVQNARKAQVPIEDVAKEISKTYGISIDKAKLIVQGFNLANDAAQTLSNTLEAMSSKTKEALTSTTSMIKAVSEEVVNTVKAQVVPKLNVNIDFALTPETIANAVRTAVLNNLPGILNELARQSISNTKKENTAKSPLL